MKTRRQGNKEIRCLTVSLSPCRLVSPSGKLATAAQFLAKPGDGEAQPFLKPDLWLPAQNALGFGDIWLTHLRIVQRAHILVDKPSRVTGQIVDHFGKLLDRVFARVADIHRLVLRRHEQPVDALDQIGDILKRAGLQAIAIGCQRLTSQRLLDKVRTTRPSRKRMRGPYVLKM